MYGHIKLMLAVNIIEDICISHMSVHSRYVEKAHENRSDMKERGQTREYACVTTTGIQYASKRMQQLKKIVCCFLIRNAGALCHTLRFASD